MNLPWKKESPIEKQMEEVAVLWAQTEVGSEEWERLKKEYMELDARRLDHKKVKKDGAITPATILGTATTVGLALLTLSYEAQDVLRSKVAPLWLRRNKY